MKEIVYDKERKVVLSNKIIKSNENVIDKAESVIKGKQAMSLQVARLIRLVISQVSMYDDDIETYTCNIPDLATFLEISSDDIYRDIKKICVDLMCSCIILGTDNPKDDWDIIHWVSNAKYNNGMIRITLSKEIKPYILGLREYFTKYRIGDILSLNSYYAIRLYEIILCKLGEKKHKTIDKKIYAEEITLTVDELRSYMGCENKLVDYYDFKRKAIQIAIREINEKTEIYIMPIYNKKGRKVDSITFVVTNNVITEENGLKVKNEYKYRCDLKKAGVKFKSTTDDDVMQALQHKKLTGDY